MPAYGYDEDGEREHEDCDWCLRGSCSGYPRYPKCGGPSGPGIDEPYDSDAEVAS